MLTFQGKTSKADVLAGLARHRELDEIRQGPYWIDHELARGGCAVGCVLHDIAPGFESEHHLLESLLGIPEGVAILVDEIFESLPEADAKAWPERFIQAVPEGADLSGVLAAFLLRFDIRGEAGEPQELATWLIEAVAEAAGEAL